MKYFVLFFSLLSLNTFATENPVKQIKKQMCFETYPRITYSQNGQYDWTINDVINNPSVYKTYKLFISNKVKNGENVVFDFTGISHQYNTNVPVTGSSYYNPTDGWTLNVNASAKLGERYSVDNTSFASSLAIWDMYASINDPGVGGGFLKFDNIIPGAAPDSKYEVSVVKSIDCKDFGKRIPSVE
jgi:hypothetical protein